MYNCAHISLLFKHVTYSTESLHTGFYMDAICSTFKEPKNMHQIVCMRSMLNNYDVSTTAFHTDYIERIATGNIYTF